MSFLECLRACKGELFKASVLWCKDRGWYSTARTEWFEAWQTTGLPAEVEAAVKTYYQDPGNGV